MTANEQSLVSNDIEIKERLAEELDKLSETTASMAAATGIPEGNINNLRAKSDRVKSVKAGMLGAFWLAYPAIDVHYILTGQRSSLPTVAITGPARITHNGHPVT